MIYIKLYLNFLDKSDFLALVYISYTFVLLTSRRGASDSITDSSVLSNPADADFVVGIFAQKALLNMGRVLSIFNS